MTVQTHPEVTRELRLAARQGLQPAKDGGWLAGFSNLLAKELGEWFGTRRWLWQILIWITIINGSTAFMLFAVPLLKSMAAGMNPALETAAEMPPELTAMFWYFSLVGMAGAIGVIIMAQDEVIQEKQTGTAAWILSKPVARPAFILTKLISNIAGALVFIIVLPGLVTIGEAYLAAHKIMPLVPFLVGMGVVFLALVFYLSLVILLGVVFQSRGPVLGISMGIMFVGVFVSQYLSQIAFALPFSMDKIAIVLGFGQPLSGMAVLGMILTAVISLVFIMVALWRFQRAEL